jgi:hypothetical protein
LLLDLDKDFGLSTDLLGGVALGGVGCGILLFHALAVYDACAHTGRLEAEQQMVSDQV